MGSLLLIRPDLKVINCACQGRLATYTSLCLTHQSWFPSERSDYGIVSIPSLVHAHACGWTMKELCFGYFWLNFDSGSHAFSSARRNRPNQHLPSWRQSALMTQTHCLCSGNCWANRQGPGWLWDFRNSPMTLKVQRKEGREREGVKGRKEN